MYFIIFQAKTICRQLFSLEPLQTRIIGCCYLCSAKVTDTILDILLGRLVDMFEKCLRRLMALLCVSQKESSFYFLIGISSSSRSLNEKNLNLSQKVLTWGNYEMAFILFYFMFFLCVHNRPKNATGSGTFC